MVALDFYTTFSILSGFGDPRDWVEGFQEAGFDFVAIADKNTQGGTIPFQEFCKEKGVKFAIGEQFDVFSSITEDDKNISEYSGSVSLYAKNWNGYKNIIKINNFAHRKLKEGGGFYFNPRIDMNILFKYSDDVVCVIPNIDGFPFASYKDGISNSYRHDPLIGHMKRVFGDRLFVGVNPMIDWDEICEFEDKLKKLETQIDRLPAAKAQERMPLKMRLEEGIQRLTNVALLNRVLKNDPTIQTIHTCNAHYPVKEAHYLYKKLREIDSGKVKNNRDRFVYNGFTPDARTLSRKGRDMGFDFISSSEKFKSHFSEGFEIPTGTFFMPEVDIRTGSVEEDLWETLLRGFKEKICPECDLEKISSVEDLKPWGHYTCYEATQRGETLGCRIYSEYKSKIEGDPSLEVTSNVFPVSDYLERLEEERSLIASKGFEPYFHIVAFFYDFVRQIGGDAGPARGSAGGSLYAYLLSITKVDPLRHNCLFERFLSEDRIDLPDIDMDFSTSTRDALEEMVKERWGKEKIVHIGTYSRLKTKSGIDTIARATGYSIPTNDGSLKQYSKRGLELIFTDAQAPQDARGLDELESLREDEKFEQFYLQHSDWFDAYVVPLYETIVGKGKHAAGAVILPEHPDELLPIEYRKGLVMTQFKDRYTELRGFPKFDFLVIDGADVLGEARRLVKERHGVEIPDEGQIPLHDRKARIEFYRVRTEMLFQYRTPVQKRFFKKLRPETFEHLVAAVALERPGPMNWGTDLLFAQYKNKLLRPEYPHEIFEELFEDTYGLLIYQESIMALAKKMAGFSGAEADKLRKVIAKKQRSKMSVMKEKFIESSVKQGFERHLCEEIWENIEGFGSYGFNLSHSVAYSLVSFTQAYIQARYPIEYVCAALKFAKKSTSVQNNLFTARAEAKNKMGVEFIYPNIHDFRADFEPNDEGTAIYWPLRAISGINTAADAMVEKGTSYDTIEDFVYNTYGGSVKVTVMDKLVAAGFFDPICPRHQAIHKVREAVYEVSGDKSHLAIPDEFVHTDDFRWVKMRNEAFKMFVEPWKELAPFSDSVRAFPGDALEKVEDGEEVTVGGIVDGIRIGRINKGKNKGKTFAKIYLKDAGEFIRIMAWSDFWEQEWLSEHGCRPELGQVVEITGIKDTYRPNESVNIPQIKLDGNSSCDIVWKERDLTADLFDN